MSPAERDSLLSFVTPFYAEKDPLHGIDHARRILDAARTIASLESLSVDDDLLFYGSMFHGLAANNVAAIRSFFGESRATLGELVCGASIASLGKSVCRTAEEQLLHDAHVIEGGSIYYYLKPLITGSFMRQSLSETLAFIDGMLSDAPLTYFPTTAARLSSFRAEARNLHARLQQQLHPHSVDSVAAHETRETTARRLDPQATPDPSTSQTVPFSPVNTDFYCEEVLSGKTQVEVVASTDRSLAFKHTNPSFPVHIVVIPRKHIPSFTATNSEHRDDLSDLMELLRQVALDVENRLGKCKITTNLGSYQDSGHLHWHVYVKE